MSTEDDAAGAAEAVARAVARIDLLNPRYRAYSYLAPDLPPQAAALDAARAAGRTRGPLHGVTVSVKGCIPVAGWPFTEGSALHAGRVALHDAEIVTRIRAAGGIVLGVTTLSELAMYAVRNAFEPMALNPWDPDRTAGGSSTGAGVAAALAMGQLHVGTDSGGSVRNPACHCGVVGFMPRRHGLPLAGQPDRTPSLTTVGLIARSVREVARGWAALGEAPEGAVAREERRPGRMLLPRRLVEAHCDQATLALFESACARLAALGFDLVEAEVPGWTEGERGAGVVSLAESGRALAAIGDLGRAGPAIRTRAAAAAALEPGAEDAARAACAALRASLSTVLHWSGASAVLTPTWPFPAPPIDAEAMPVQGESVPLDPRRSCFVRAANAANGCAVTLPMGLYPEARVPAGLHLLASGGAEATLIALAAAVESALPPAPRPPVYG